MIQNKNNALVVGASSFVGTAICEKLKNNNFNILKHTFKRKKNNNDFECCDFSKKENIENFFKNDFFKNKKIDLFVSCIGGNKGFDSLPLQLDSCFKMKHEDVKWIVETNFLINVLLMKHVIPLMNKNSNIIFTSSSVISNTRDLGQVGVYASAKAGLNEYAFHLANELKNLLIFANVISFGGIGEEKGQTSVIEIANEIINIANKKYQSGKIVAIVKN